MIAESWPRHPVVYEINTCVWLGELGLAAGRKLTLAEVPAAVWDEIAALRVDAVWLMGVWERSPAGRAVSLANGPLVAEFRRALPDYRDEDNLGSPYCVHRYEVDPRFGGRAALAAARAALAARGVRLLLDYVPNHLALDHPWVAEHPDYFVRGDGDDLAQAPGDFCLLGGTVFACGRDPSFPAWADTIQVDAFSPGLRAAALETLVDIASQCDGVRCDMAMLLLDDVFGDTWGRRVGSPLPLPFWQELIAGVRRFFPACRFLAEAYWDREWDLQQQGFDACYDKRLLERLEHRNPDGVRRHLGAGLDYQERLVRFLENHDEPRAAATFDPGPARTAAIAFATLPGTRLLHEGQLEGRRVRLPVFLARRPAEPLDDDLRGFYRRLLTAIATPALREGAWQLLEITGWPDNRSFENLLAWSWELAAERHVVVVNLSGWTAQGRVRFPWHDLAGSRLRLREAFAGETFERDGDEASGPGLYVELTGWGWHFFSVATA